MKNVGLMSIDIYIYTVNHEVRCRKPNPETPLLTRNSELHETKRLRGNTGIAQDRLS